MADHVKGFYIEFVEQLPDGQVQRTGEMLDPTTVLMAVDPGKALFDHFNKLNALHNGVIETRKQEARDAAKKKPIFKQKYPQS